MNPWECNCGWVNMLGEAKCSSCGMKKDVSIPVDYTIILTGSSKEGKYNATWTPIVEFPIRAEARKILVKHIGVGGEGTFVSCSTDKLIDAIVEALETKNEK